MNGTRKRKMRRRIKYHRLLLLIVLFVLLIVGFLMLPIFNISGVEVVGNSKVTKESIISGAGISKEDKFFFLNKGEIEERILNNTYIESVDIKKNFPNKVTLEIKERRSAATIQLMNNYLLIDKWGYIIDKSSSLLLNLSNIKGIENTADMEMGEQIFKYVTTEQNKLLEALFNGDAISKFKSVTLTEDKAELVLNGDVMVAFGSYNNVEYKLKVLDQMIVSINDNKSQRAVMILMEEGPNPILVNEQN